MNQISWIVIIIILKGLIKKNKINVWILLWVHFTSKEKNRLPWLLNRLLFFYGPKITDWLLIGIYCPYFYLFLPLNKIVFYFCSLMFLLYLYWYIIPEPTITTQTLPILTNHKTPPLRNTWTSDLEINNTGLYLEFRVPSNIIVKNSKCFNKSELTLTDYIEKVPKPYF